MVIKIILRLVAIAIALAGAHESARAQIPHNQALTVAFKEGPVNVTVVTWATPTYDLSFRVVVIDERSPAGIASIEVKTGSKRLALCSPPPDGVCAFTWSKVGMALNPDFTVKYVAKSGQTFTYAGTVRRPNSTIAADAPLPPPVQTAYCLDDAGGKLTTSTGERLICG